MKDKGYTLTPYDKARAQMTQAEYKAWVEQGIWPKRIVKPARKSDENIGHDTKRNLNA